MEFVVLLIIGVLIGFFGRGLVIKRASIGVLRLDRSDPDGPHLFLEMKEDSMQRIQSSKYVTMEVNLKSYISRD